MGIRFDRRLADHGYAYVAVSRVRRRLDVYLIGSVPTHRLAARPERGLGTSELSVLSLSDSEEPESEDPSTDKSDEGPSSGAYSDFAMDVESAEEPDDRSEDLDQEMGMDHHSEKDDDMGRRFIDDSSGLFT